MQQNIDGGGGLRGRGRFKENMNGGDVHQTSLIVFRVGCQSGETCGGGAFKPDPRQQRMKGPQGPRAGALWERASVLPACHGAWYLMVFPRMFAE